MSDARTAPAGAPRSPLRRALTLGAAAAVVAGVWSLPGAVRRLLPADFEFEPLDEPKGFRRLVAGSVTAGLDPFVGLGSSGPPPEPPADICRALFGSEPLAPGVVPVAAFSDYYCPHCRVLTRRLAALEAEDGSRLRVSWREWPLLGGPSEVAARAALAAARQGAYPAFHEALGRGGFAPTPAFLDRLAERIGVDAARLRADMDSPAVAAEIAETQAVARLFGFPGTPALVVGRTVVEGVIDEDALRRLLALERADGPPPGCGAA